MPTYVVYNEILTHLDHAFCASMPRDELRRQVMQLIANIEAREKWAMPRWEHQLLIRQLLLTLPHGEHAPA